MGVNLLWKILEPYKESKSLTLFGEEHILRSRSEGKHGHHAIPKVGVDMGTCMAECNAGARISGVHSQHAGGGLYNFFKRLTEYIKTPIAFIFVFDGTRRPHYKRGRKVIPQPIWWADLAIELIKAFGHEVHHAPAEAEAELARMNSEGLIDAVITSDSDAYVFGTKILLRSLPRNNRRYPNEYIIYSSESETMPMLSHGGLILFALLSGGDYSVGIKGCGSSTGLALAKCGYGEQLLNALDGLDSASYDTFLVQWRADIQAELLTNSRGFLSCRQPALAASINDKFPSRRILKLYSHPLTSWSPGQTPPDASQWIFQPPSIVTIRKFTCRHLRWKDPVKMKEDFNKMLWKGIFLQMLYSPSATYIAAVEGNSQYSGKLKLEDPDYPTADILEVKHQVRRGQYAQEFGTSPQPMLVVSALHFVESMGYNFARSLSADKFTVWPQLALLPRQLALQLEGSPPSSLGSEDNVDDINWVLVAEKHWYADLT